MITRALRPGVGPFRRLATRCRRPLLPHGPWRGLCSASDDDAMCRHDDGSSPSDSSNIFPGAQHGADKMAVVFTCKVCDTRTGKTMTKQAYYHGVVLARCPGCDNLHLIADRLGWFEDESTDIMDIVRKRGEEAKFVRSEEDLLELALEDVAGADKVEEAVRGAMQGSSQAAAEEAGNGGTPAGGRGGGESAQ